MSQVITDLRKVIPKKYFKINNKKAIFYLSFDVVLLILNSIFGYYLIINQTPLLIPLIIIQGLIFTALWVIAHECGHESFLTYKKFNHAIGYTIHSALLVPYKNWAHTHNNHHNYNHCLDRDEVHVPKDIKDPGYIDSPMKHILRFILTPFFLHIYFHFNVASGRQYDKLKNCNHFSLKSPLLKDMKKSDILLSNLGYFISLLIMVTATIFFTKFFLFLYWLPLLVNTSMIVAITLLHHTDKDLLYFSKDNFSYEKGAIQTIDRSIGFKNCIGFLLHHISDSHVTHHFFRKMPFYHAKKATPYVKQYLGKFYKEDHSMFFLAFFKAILICAVDKIGVGIYRNSRKNNSGD